MKMLQKTPSTFFISTVLNPCISDATVKAKKKKKERKKEKNMVIKSSFCSF
jgi:hypothetical protein